MVRGFGLDAYAYASPADHVYGDYGQNLIDVHNRHGKVPGFVHLRSS